MAALLISQTALENLSVNASSDNLPRDLTEPLDQTTCYELFLFLGRRQDMDPVSRERREVGGQAALAKLAMGLTSASNSGSKPDPSLPLRTAHWSRRSAPR